MKIIILFYNDERYLNAFTEEKIPRLIKIKGSYKLSFKESTSQTSKEIGVFNKGETFLITKVVYYNSLLAKDFACWLEDSKLISYVIDCRNIVSNLNDKEFLNYLK